MFECGRLWVVPNSFVFQNKSSKEDVHKTSKEDVHKTSKEDTRLLGGVYVPCIYRIGMPGGVIVGDSGLLLCAGSMCDVNCSSAITSH